MKQKTFEVLDCKNCMASYQTGMWMVITQEYDTYSAGTWIVIIQGIHANHTGYGSLILL